ncbi:dTDP-4-dehydrorhamnose reductase [Caldimonas sp. KR1-144]|uniref:dTDP-4-dehydrorhamnose reductase n=1 Tax=Caldimonas sp. KR1-144 TaxID=3400911 RepID=UPI003C0A38B1
MKLLLLGHRGQLGWELQRSLAPLGDIVTAERHVADFSRPDQLAALVKSQRPRIVVNAAAYTAVDRAESEPELARAVNALTPGALARECAAIDAILVHYSSDYVLDGSGNTPRDESASTAPLNAYGRTKLEGETLVRASGCRHLMLRTSWVYSARGSNFPKTMLRLAAERDRLTVVDDQFGAPTSAELLADVTAHALSTVLRRPDLCGLYHVAAGGETSWHALATFVIEHARAAGAPILVAANAIEAVHSEAFSTAARRPANSRLDTSRFRTTFGLNLPHWQRGMERLLDELLAR